MAWNGSDTEKAKARGEGEQRRGKFRSSTSTHHFNYKALVAGLVVVIGGGLAAYFMLGRSGESDIADDGRGGARPSRIVEAKPHRIVTNAVEEAVTPRSKVLSREDRIRIYEERYGTNMPPAIRSVVYHLKNPPKETYHQPKTRVQIFKNRCDRKIASVLLIEPGKFMLRKPTFDERFDRDFVENLHVNEEMADGDSEEDKELKRAVADTKKELSRQVRETGMKPSEIMNAEAENLFELGRYKRDLEKELRNLRKDASLADDDVRDFVTAANKMLEAKGLSGFKMPNMVARQAMLSKRGERRAAAGKAEDKVNDKNK